MQTVTLLACRHVCRWDKVIDAKSQHNPRHVGSTALVDIRLIGFLESSLPRSVWWLHDAHLQPGCCLLKLLLIKLTCAFRVLLSVKVVINSEVSCLELHLGLIRCRWGGKDGQGKERTSRCSNTPEGPLLGRWNHLEACHPLHQAPHPTSVSRTYSS